MKVENIKVGDRIRFHAVTAWSNRAAWRVVTGIKPLSVRFGGWSNFLVRHYEILEHQGRE
jgi:hypothetical protein